MALNRAISLTVTSESFTQTYLSSSPEANTHTNLVINVFSSLLIYDLQDMGILQPLCMML